MGPPTNLQPQPPPQQLPPEVAKNSQAGPQLVGKGLNSITPVMNQQATTATATPHPPSPVVVPQTVKKTQPPPLPTTLVHTPVYKAAPVLPVEPLVAKQSIKTLPPPLSTTVKVTLPVEPLAHVPTPTSVVTPVVAKQNVKKPPPLTTVVQTATPSTSVVQTATPTTTVVQSPIPTSVRTVMTAPSGTIPSKSSLRDYRRPTKPKLSTSAVSSSKFLKSK